MSYEECIRTHKAQSAFQLVGGSVRDCCVLCVANKGAPKFEILIDTAV